MLRSQILALAVGVVLIVILYNLPKVIINETDKVKMEKGSEPHQLIANLSSTSQEAIPQNISSRITKIRNSYQQTSEVKKRIIFADSLANLFADYHKNDSSEKYADEMVLLNRDNQSLRMAGDIYFKIYSTSENPTDANKYAFKAQELYKEILKHNDGDLDVKNNLAMTYVTSENPMQAISLLREVLTKDPLNENALFNLGFLSIQSGQYDKAIERFNKLIELNQRNWKAHLYLGLAFRKTGREEDAIKQFVTVKENTKDSKLKAEADRNLSSKN